MGELEDRNHLLLTDDDRDTGSGIPVVSSLYPTARRFSQRALLNAALVILAAILLLALSVRWLPAVIASRTSATPTRTILYPDTLPIPTPGSGWLAAGPDWAQTISLAADGSVGYACGQPDAINGHPYIHIARFDAARQSWQDSIGPAFADQCWISVSPTNANELALILRGCSPEGDCTTGVDFGPGSLYRSHDGGQSWTRIQLPSNEAPEMDVWLNDGTLALTTIGTNPPPNMPSPYSLYLVHPDNWYAQVDTERLLGHNFVQLQYIGIFSGGSTLYAVMDTMPCGQECSLDSMAKTSDDGQHWSMSSLKYQGNILTIDSAQFATNTLLAWNYGPDSSTLVRSTDGGASWQPLPMLTNSAQNHGEIGVHTSLLPDNSVIAWDTDISARVYMLPAGSTTWLPLVVAPLGTPLGVQCDAQGHPIALWALAYPFTTGGAAASPGLAYYPISHNLP